MKKIRYLLVLAALPLTACAALGIGGTTSEITHNLLDEDYEFASEALGEAYQETVELAEEIANDAPDDGEVYIGALDPEEEEGRGVVSVLFRLDGNTFTEEGLEWRDKWLDDIHGPADEFAASLERFEQTLHGSMIMIEYSE